MLFLLLLRLSLRKLLSPAKGWEQRLISNDERDGGWQQLSCRRIRGLQRQTPKSGRIELAITDQENVLLGRFTANIWKEGADFFHAKERMRL